MRFGRSSKFGQYQKVDRVRVKFRRNIMEGGHSSPFYKKGKKAKQKGEKKRGHKGSPVGPGSGSEGGVHCVSGEHYTFFFSFLCLSLGLPPLQPPLHMSPMTC
jgi:hypothetical protein